MFARFICLDACGAILREHGFGAVTLKGSYVRRSGFTLQTDARKHPPGLVNNPFWKRQDWPVSHCWPPPVNKDNASRQVINVRADKCLGRAWKVRSDDADSGFRSSFQGSSPILAPTQPKRAFASEPAQYIPKHCLRFCPGAAFRSIR